MKKDGTVTSTYFEKKPNSFKKKKSKKSKYVLLCWDTSGAAGHRGDIWRVPPVSRWGFYEHSSLYTFTREHCHCFMWSSPVKIKSLCPEGLLRRRPFFDSVQLHSWCPQKFCEVNTSPQLGQQRHITIPVMGWLNFLGSWEEPCMAMVVQAETMLEIRIYPLNKKIRNLFLGCSGSSGPPSYSLFLFRPYSKSVLVSLLIFCLFIYLYVTYRSSSSKQQCNQFGFTPLAVPWCLQIFWSADHNDN